MTQAERAAFRAGAEAMRKAAVAHHRGLEVHYDALSKESCGELWNNDVVRWSIYRASADAIAALPIPEPPHE